jgi:hypothetical protein
VRLDISGTSGPSFSADKKYILSMPEAATLEASDLTEPALVGGVYMLCLAFEIFWRVNPWG